MDVDSNGSSVEQDILEAQSPLEEFMENRFLAAERYTAFLVSFHSMAELVASFWPLRFQAGRLTIITPPQPQRRRLINSLIYSLSDDSYLD